MAKILHKTIINGRYAVIVQRNNGIVGAYITVNHNTNDTDFIWRCQDNVEITFHDNNCVVDSETGEYKDKEGVNTVGFFASDYTFTIPETCDALLRIADFDAVYKSLTGLSVSLCIKDIMRGTVKIDHVKRIIAGTKCNNIADWDEVTNSYIKTYWRDNPSQALRIFEELYTKIEQPRTDWCNLPQPVGFQKDIWLKRGTIDANGYYIPDIDYSSTTPEYERDMYIKHWYKPESREETDFTLVWGHGPDGIDRAYEDQR